jgi:hypothetical protein
MRIITVLAFIGLPALIPAQHVPVINPSRGMIAPSNAYRYGNILFPGGISQQVPAPHLNSHAGRLGGVVSGSIPYTGVPPGQQGRFPGRTVVVPYAYPVFYGSGYGYGGYGYEGYGQEPQAPNVTVVVPQQPVPQVVINNSYVPDTAKPVLREYSPGELPESNVRVYEGPSKPRTESAANSGGSIMDQKPTIYLVALKDGTIRQAIGYWVKGDVFHYVTPNSAMNHVSIDMVDRERSVELNAERKLEFDLKLSH